jgi:hypothetical protein
VYYSPTSELVVSEFPSVVLSVLKTMQGAWCRGEWHDILSFIIQILFCNQIDSCLLQMKAAWA